MNEKNDQIKINQKIKSIVDNIIFEELRLQDKISDIAFICFLLEKCTEVELKHYNTKRNFQKVGGFTNLICDMYLKAYNDKLTK